MFLDWFNAREAQEFGNGLAEFLDGKLREAENVSDKKKLERKHKFVTLALEKSREFRAGHKLNLYKKAQLANAFKWRLKELGHDDALITEITKELVIALQ